MPQLTSSDRIGTTVGGRYEIRRLLGEGGFSAVFEAVHNVTGREVALKLLHPHLVTTEQITERFLMEARAMARIRHDGIVQVLDAGKDPDGTVYIALELLSGESLETTLQRAGRLTWGEAVSIGIDVLGALAEAHRNKIIHRDIKPGNIFLVRKPDGSSQAKLLDFGIAHVAQAKGKLTQAGMILGTPEYTSPEQGRSGNVGPEADLWSVGIVLYECITGATPFMSESTTEILLKVQTETAPRLIDVEPSVPLPVSLAVQHALAREVKDRYRSADDMREALQKAVADADRARGEPQRSVFRAPSLRRLPPETMDDLVAGTAPPASTAPPPRTEVLPPTVSASVAPTGPQRAATKLSAQLGRPTAPPKSALKDRAPSGGRTFELPESEPVADVRAVRASRPDEPVQVIKPGRLVVEEVVSSRRFDFDEEDSRRIRRTSPAPDAPLKGRVATPLEGARFTLDETPSLPPPPAPGLGISGNVAVHLSANPTPVTGAKPDAAEHREEFRLAEPGDRLSGPELKRPIPVPTRSPASPSTPTTLSGAARETERAAAANRFSAPPLGQKVPWIVGGAAAVVLLGGLIASRALTGGGDTPRHPAARDVTEPAVGVADAGSPQAPARALALQFRELHTIRPPSEVVGDVSEVARHAAVSRGEAITTQRVVATCVPGADGQPSLYFHPVLRGEALGSVRAPIACAGFDLGVVSDVTGDGTDDVIAISADHNAVLLFDSASRGLARTFPLPGARGIAVGGGFAGPGDTYAVVYTEPGGDEQPTMVVALGLRTGRILWRASGGRGLGRFGQPVELGLAVGRDIDRDNVADVAVGIGPIIGRNATGERPQRCVEVISGAQGTALWNPQCRARGRGSQSVSIGPDVTGDGVPDVAVGTDRPEGTEPAVEIRSGVDGQEFRTLSLPPGETSTGFGWPVALVGPMERNGRAKLVVGSVGGSSTGVYVFDPREGALQGRLQLQGIGSATLRLFGVESNVRNGPWSLAVGAPADGVRIYAVTASEDGDN